MGTTSWDVAGTAGGPAKALLLLGLLSTSACAAGGDQVRSHQPAAFVFEDRLRRSVTDIETPSERLRLADRMVHYKVPGLSVAVIEDCKILRAQGFGVTAADAVPVGADTLFQAASISKPVAALGAMRLVERGKLGLDDDVQSRLRGWALPPSALMVDQPVTLRRLLSHGAGLTVHGFGGYRAGKPLPTVVEILDGKSPANSGAVRVDKVPGSGWRYSGGGYTVAQLLMSEVADRDFGGLMKELVLAPLGMTHSTYEQPLPAAWGPRAASGHRADGAMVPGRWHTYPEMAAAGLWTTPSDLARFAIGVIRADQGARKAIVGPAIADEMLRQQVGEWGIGLELAGSGRARSFKHGGANAGYRAHVVAFPETCQGAAIMTNSDNGGPLITEVLRSLSDTYSWPDKMEPRQVSRVQLDGVQRAGFVGTYELTQDPATKVEIVDDGGSLGLIISAGLKRELWAESPTRLISVDDAIVVERSPDAGAAQTLDLQFSKTTRHTARRTIDPAATSLISASPALVRPQDPAKPYPYKEIEVGYPNRAQSGVHLAGTLTVPLHKGPFPAVLLITGSGRQDRDETLFGHKPFLVLADYLTRRGIAVLRVDDRGAGGSTGASPSNTTNDFASDVRAGVEFLKTRPEIDGKQIGLIGHSEGGLIAPLAAKDNPSVAFAVLWAGTGTSGRNVIIEQVRAVAAASGAPPEIVAANVKKQRELVDAVIKAPDQATAYADAMKIALAAGETEEKAGPGLRFMTGAWFRNFLVYDPAPTLRALDIPVLALIGAKDVQVVASQNTPALEAALARNKRAKVMELSGLNHLFQNADTGAVSEYGTLTQTIAPEALKIMGDWIVGLTGKAQNDTRTGRKTRRRQPR